MNPSNLRIRSSFYYIILNKTTGELPKNYLIKEYHMVRIYNL